MDPGSERVKLWKALVVQMGAINIKTDFRLCLTD